MVFGTNFLFFIQKERIYIQASTFIVEEIGGKNIYFNKEVNQNKEIKEMTNVINFLDKVVGNINVLKEENFIVMENDIDSKVIFRKKF